MLEKLIIKAICFIIFDNIFQGNLTFFKFFKVETFVEIFLKKF